MEEFDWNEIFRRALKYLFEGLAVGISAFLIGRTLKAEQVIMIALTASAMYSILDMYAPSIGTSSRVGTGLAAGSALIGGF